MKKILYIDIDGVLANIAKSYNAYKEKYPEQPYPQSQYGFFYGNGTYQTCNRKCRISCTIF